MDQDLHMHINFRKKNTCVFILEEIVMVCRAIYQIFSNFLFHYLTNLMHKICFTISFISCLYMFRAHVLIIRRSKLYYTASGIIKPIGGRLVHRLREDSQPVHERATYRCDNTRTRGCIIKF